MRNWQMASSPSIFLLDLAILVDLFYSSIFSFQYDLATLSLDTNLKDLTIPLDLGLDAALLLRIHERRAYCDYFARVGLANTGESRKGTAGTGYGRSRGKPAAIARDEHLAMC